MINASLQNKSFKSKKRSYLELKLRIKVKKDLTRRQVVLCNCPGQAYMIEHIRDDDLGYIFIILRSDCGRHAPAIFEAVVSGQMRLKCYDCAQYHRVIS